jgi:selenocysteine lyase/cysteine desulfurase
MAAAAHDAGALLFVDAIQGLGVFPLDVRDAGIDFFAADGHKWLLGPEGAGLLYVRREHLDRLRPLGVGWNSVVHDHDFDRIALDWKPSAERYEGGSPNMPGLLALGASLDLLSTLDIPEIGRRILEIVDVTARRLEAIGATVTLPESAACRSGIVCFDLPGQDPQAIRRRCRQHGVVLSCRSGRLRISPHAYASNEDIDQLIAALTDAGP